jgi:hypothetical protein
MAAESHTSGSRHTRSAEGRITRNWIRQYPHPQSTNPQIVSHVPECFLPHKGTLYGVAARSPNDIWAVGVRYEFNNQGVGINHPLTLHWDGYCWHEIPSPMVGDGAELFAVAVVPPDEAWAVGVFEALVNGNPVIRTLAMKWTPNAGWQVSPSQFVGDVSYLWGVSGTAATDVWAVGHFEDQNLQTLVQHWDGQAWTLVSSPNVGGQFTGNTLAAVTSLAVDEVWAVGEGAGHTLVEHWDGQHWTIVESPDAPDDETDQFKGGPANGLWGVAAASPQAIWSVGAYKSLKLNSEALALRGDPQHWEYIPHPTFPKAKPPDQHSLRGVAIDSLGHAWAAGEAHIGAGPWTALIAHWTGASWHVSFGANIGPLAGVLRGVAALAANDVWAVGWYVIQNIQVCLIQHWDGNSWTQFP